jgi:cytochrome c oxidase subunit 2
MKHFLAVTVIVLVLTVLVGLGLNSTGMLPAQASLEAGPIDAMFRFHFWAIAFLFALIVGFMIYSMIVFRRKPGDEEDGKYITGNTGLEIIWTLIPLGVVLFLAFWGADVLAEIRRPDPQALEVTVTGRQWSWQFEYPEYGVRSAELRLPVGKQALLTLTSTDVIHAFWVPEFRVKQDALPGEGMERELRVTPTEIGEYTVRCAEVCGTAHAYMNAPVIVMAEEQFQAWITAEASGEESAEQDPVEVGRQVSEESGCLACHSADGSESIGPTWLDLYGAERELADGSTVTADREYLRTAILEPQVEIVQGYENIVMPPTGENLTDQEIEAVLAYIESLSGSSQ